MSSLPTTEASPLHPRKKFPLAVRSRSPPILRPFEQVTFAYLVWLLALLATFHHNIPHAAKFAALHLAIAAAIAQLAWSSARSPESSPSFRAPLVSAPALHFLLRRTAIPRPRHLSQLVRPLPNPIRLQPGRRASFRLARPFRHSLAQRRHAVRLHDLFPLPRNPPRHPLHRKKIAPPSGP